MDLASKGAATEETDVPSYLSGINNCIGELRATRNALRSNWLAIDDAERQRDGVNAGWKSSSSRDL